MNLFDYKNRKDTPLPDNNCSIQIIQNDVIYNCDQKPFNPSNYSANDLPAKGYLGTATVISGYYKGIGFNVWEQNDSEFIYYKILD